MSEGSTFGNAARIDSRRVPRTEIRHDRQPLRRLGVVDDSRHAAHLRQAQTVHHRRHGAGHDDEEQAEVRPDHAADPAEERVDDRRNHGDDEDRPRVDAEEDGADLDRREDHVAQHQHVEDHAEVERAHGPQRRRRLPRVAELVELDVGGDARLHPQLRVHEHGQQAGEDERPHDPVAAHAVAADHLREEVGGVRGRRGRDHRKPDQPPRHRVPGVEEVARRAAALERRQRGDEGEQDEESGDDRPVVSVQQHVTPPPE